MQQRSELLGRPRLFGEDVRGRHLRGLVGADVFSFRRAFDFSIKEPHDVRAHGLAVYEPHENTIEEPFARTGCSTKERQRQ